MPKRIIPHLQQTLAEHGLLAAIGAFFAAMFALAISTVRRAFTNEEAVKRIEKAITDRIDQWERARQQDREEMRREIREIRDEHREEMKRLHERVDEIYARGGS